MSTHILLNKSYPRTTKVKNKRGNNFVKNSEERENMKEAHVLSIKVYGAL